MPQLKFKYLNQLILDSYYKNELEKFGLFIGPKLLFLKGSQLLVDNHYISAQLEKMPTAGELHRRINLLLCNDSLCIKFKRKIFNHLQPIDVYFNYSLKCHQWRIPFILSPFATFLHWYAFLVIVFTVIDREII